jgi:hypothetical protein
MGKLTLFRLDGRLEGVLGVLHMKRDQARLGIGGCLLRAEVLCELDLI